MSPAYVIFTERGIAISIRSAVMKLIFFCASVLLSISFSKLYDLIFGVLYSVFGGSGSYSCAGVRVGHNVIDEW